MVWILLLSWLFSVASYKMITPSQWDFLHHYLKSPSTTPSMKNKANLILFHRHLPLVHKMVYDFRAYHKRKSMNIMNDDLLFYGYKGLYDSVRKYNPEYNFVQFAKIYIQGALYKGISVHNPISKQSMKERRKRVVFKDAAIYELRRNYYLRHKDFIASPKPIYEDDYLYAQIWNKINDFKPFAKRLFYLKFDFYLNKIRSNKEVALLMDCSEEWARRNIHNHVKILAQNYSYVLLD